jgi:HEAT repeat protein
MKQNSLKIKCFRVKYFTIISVFIFLLNLIFPVYAQGDSTGQIEYNEILASIRSDKSDPFDKIALKLNVERQQAVNELISIFEDKKSSNFQQCAAAYYLGEWRASEAVDALTANISLSLEQLSSDHIEVLNLSAAAALIKIGNPSIPAVIRNLLESDNPVVRKLSLQVLCRIDGDKDIVQLRLKKALAAEKDSQKQARLQAASKALTELH